MSLPPSPAATRALRLDALRGLAIVWMVAFHFSFDLNHLGFLQPPHNFYRDALWTTQRTLIVSLFLLCAGMGQALAEAGGQGWPRFWRRWVQVASCALLVSAGSALMFPKSWISFGVLHGMAVMLLLVRLWCGMAARAQVPDKANAAGKRLGWPALLVAGALALALPQLWQHPVFDQRLLNWVGLVTRKPITEDFVPVLPWLGVMLWGLALGRWLLAHRPAWLSGHMPALAQPLVWLGQRPLTVYMLHQPLLIGALMAWRAALH